MCGRFSRARQGLDYVVPLFPDATYPDEGDPFRPSWNVAPSQLQPVLRAEGVHMEKWGHRPAWAVARKIPLMVNARIDKAGSSTWKSLWKNGRVIVPADGWYEWIATEAGKQPYFIVPIDGEPLYFAGLSSVRPGSPTPQEGDGFVIVTDAAEAGMLDVHDRRPLVLSAQDARQWLEPSTTFEEALHLATDLGTPVEAFRWFPVSKGVNKATNNDPSFNDPIEEAEPKIE